MRSPVEILPSQTTGRVGGVRLEINKLEVSMCIDMCVGSILHVFCHRCIHFHVQKALDEKVASYKAVGTGEYEDIKCDMVFYNATDSISQW